MTSAKMMIKILDRLSHDPISIGDLSKAVDRQENNLRADLKEMEKLEFVEKKKHVRIVKNRVRRVGWVKTPKGEQFKNLLKTSWKTAETQRAQETETPIHQGSTPGGR